MAIFGRHEFRRGRVERFCWAASLHLMTLEDRGPSRFLTFTLTKRL